MRLAVDRVDGHWRAGFVATNELGESVFVRHAIGPDEGTATSRLARLAVDAGLTERCGAEQREPGL